MRTLRTKRLTIEVTEGTLLWLDLFAESGLYGQTRAVAAERLLTWAILKTATDYKLEPPKGRTTPKSTLRRHGARND